MIDIDIPDVFGGMFEPWRFRVYYGGRGGGKSESVCRALLAIGMKNPIRVLCCREFQASIADSVHKLLSDIIRNYGLEPFYEITQTTIRGKNGTEFIFKGLKHNANEIKSMAGIDYCFVEEAEKVSNNSWELLIPTIRKEGSSITIVFNPKNISDPTYQRFVATKYDDALVQKVSWEDNPFFPEVLQKERLRLLEVDPEAYEHVWQGNFDTRRSGAVYAKQLAKAREEGRITLVPYDPSSEVFTAWDLGHGDATSIWWLQFVGRELRWLEYYENSGEQLDHYVRVVKPKPYNYAKHGHFLPHDGAHNNIRGESVSRQLLGMGLSNTVLQRESDINPGIETLRQTLAFSVFDEKKCRDGIHALENYAYEWDEDRGVFKSKPTHNWTSHAADSARYAAIAASSLKKTVLPINDPFATTGKRSSWME
jgi:phage terminase large subunit